MFSIGFDHHERCLFVRREGFLDLGEAVCFRDAMRSALVEREREGAPFTLLIDNSAGQPLTSDVAAYFEYLAADIRICRARRIAFISPGAVNRVQARRITRAECDARIRFFEDASAAGAWLTACGTAVHQRRSAAA